MNKEKHWVTIEGAEGPGKRPGKGRHILFISGDEEYRSEESLPMLAQILAKHHGFKCTVLFAVDPQSGCVAPDVLNNIPGMNLVEAADMIVLLIRFRKLPDEDMKRFIDYTFSGKPLLALRTSTHAFNYGSSSDSPYAKYSCEDKEYDGGYGRQVLGETWVSHHGHHAFESTRAIPKADKKNHAILQGVDNMWGPCDVYEAHPPKDAEVLVDGHVLTGMDQSDPLKPDTPTMPVAWIRQPGKPEGTGRVFCSTMGASVDFLDSSLRRLVINGIYWCMGLEKQISLDQCIDPVGKFEPTYFGYGDFQKDKKPKNFFG